MRQWVERENEKVKKEKRKVKSEWKKEGRYERSGESATERRLKGDNVMSRICHDFTHLCGDKVMNVNDRRLPDVQNASPM